MNVIILFTYLFIAGIFIAIARELLFDALAKSLPQPHDIKHIVSRIDNFDDPVVSHGMRLLNYSRLEPFSYCNSPCSRRGCYRYCSLTDGHSDEHDCGGH